MRVHLLNQYLWPDAAPTGLYAEDLADRLTTAGLDAILVGGGGSYRSTTRPQPATPSVTLRTQQGKRGSHVSTLFEYASVSAAFGSYIARSVEAGDVVIVTSAPPSSITLHRAIRRRGAIGVYWLQDYYPELLRGVWDYPDVVRSALAAFWNSHLRRWTHVVKAASNLGYHGTNARVLRNWPTLDFPEPVAPEPGTALYSGNFGYGHDVASFVESCAQLRRGGYQITVRGDGPGVAKLPAWIDVCPPFRSAEELRSGLQRGEVHLVAAHPDIRAAIFPSKIWNSLAAGRRVVGSGFEREMLAEFEESTCAPFHRHLERWADFVLSLQTT